MSIPDETPAADFKVADLAAYVWSSDGIYRRRYQKSVDAAAAVAHVLAETPLLDGREAEFLALYEACLALDGDAFASVWQDPAALGWAVYTYHSVGVLGALKADRAVGKPVDDDHAFVEAALADQLDFFKALAVGMHAVAGVDLALRAPLDVRLPFAIPGTRFLLDGEGKAQLHGARDGMPLAGAPARIAELPLVDRRGCHILLNPWAGQVPHIDCIEVEHAARFPATAGPQARAAIDRAIDWIAQYAPDEFAIFKTWTRCLAVKLPQADGSGGVGSASFTFLPGLIHLKLVANPLWLAESFIHEAYHNRLFFLDEDTHILREIPGPAIHYSPWRDDTRPPHGILHAIAVFLPVTRFMLAIYRSGALAGDDAAYALDFVVRQRWRTRIGIDVLESVGEFTDEGRRVFDEIVRTATALDSAIDAASLPTDGPALHLDKPSARFLPSRDAATGRPMTSSEALVEHIRRCDHKGQAAAWVARIEESAR